MELSLPDHNLLDGLDFDDVGISPTSLVLNGRVSPNSLNTNESAHARQCVPPPRVSPLPLDAPMFHCQPRA